MTMRKTPKPPSGAWGRMDLEQEPLAVAHEASLRKRWKWLRTFPEYVADFESLRKSFPLHDEYERSGREEKFQLLDIMGLAHQLWKEGYFDCLHKLRIKYNLIGPPPDPRHAHLTTAEMRVVFEPTTGLPLQAAEHSDANATMQWALFTESTATVSDPNHQKVLARAGRLPVVSDRNGIAFLVHDGVAWIPITGWDTKQTIQAKRKLARSYLANDTGLSRWRKSRPRPTAVQLNVEVFPDGSVRVPICLADNSATITRRIESARKLVRTRTGWCRPPRMNPWETAKVAQLMSERIPEREALRAVGLDAVDVEDEATSQHVEARARELQIGGLSPTAAQVAALHELVEYTPDRVLRSREHSRARRRRGRRLP